MATVDADDQLVLRSFVRGLRRDQDAVTASSDQPLSDTPRSAWRSDTGWRSLSVWDVSSATDIGMSSTYFSRCASVGTCRELPRISHRVVERTDVAPSRRRGTRYPVPFGGCRAAGWFAARCWRRSAVR